jgi:ribose/xylose/arabinose/galactoside ABC-type transport system permease subunit
MKKRDLSVEVSMLAVLLGIALVFELLGWIYIGQSFLANKPRLSIIVLQVSVVGIIAIGVTQVIIAGGIDLSSGSIVGLVALVAASLAQASFNIAPIYPNLTDLSPIIPVSAGLAVGLVAGAINGLIIARAMVPAFIATLGMMVSVRGLTQWYTDGVPVAMLTPQFTWLAKSFNIFGFPLPMPVIIFLGLALVCHVALGYTRYGKFTYAIGANVQAARVSGINVGTHLIKVYAVAGLLAGLAGVVTAARAASGQPGMGTGYELDAIAGTVIGGASLAGGTGSIIGTVIGTLILGVVTSGFTFLGVGTYYQDIIKGAIIVGAVVVDQRRRRA